MALYLIGITLFGLRFSRRAHSALGSKQEKSLKSYFLADNTIPWWAIALSIVSAETSTLTIISIPGVAFAGDLGFLQVVLGYMLGRVVVALLFLPKYFRGEMLTAYQLIDRRFGPVLHKLTAGLFLLTRAAAEGVRVFAISIVVGLAIGTGDILSIAIISALTLLYTFEGGLAAVIWTDVVQMALYVAGTLVAIWSLGHHVPGGWTTIHALAAPLGKFHWLNFTLNLTTAYTFWAGLLGGTFLTMASHGTDQLMVQRLLAARNLRESRLALLSSGAVIFLQFTLFLLIGVGLFVFYGPTNPGTNPGAPFIAHSAMSGIANLSPDRIFPTFIVHGMPHGIAGLLVAAILAAAMSNLSAALNSLASTTVIDFWMPLRARRAPHPHDSLTVVRVGLERSSTLPEQPAPPKMSQASLSNQDRERTIVSRLSTVFWALVLFAIAVYAIQHGGRGHVVETGLSIASVAYGCLLGVFLLGTLTKYATQTGTILGMITGLVLNLILWLLPGAVIYGCKAFDPEDNLNLQAVNCITIPHIAFTWYVLIGSLATFAVGTLFSLLLPRRKPATAVALLLLCLSFLCPSCLSFRSEAQESASAVAVARSAVAVAYRYPKASALGLSSGKEDSGLQPLGYAFSSQPQQSAPTPDFTPASTLITQAIAAHKLPGAVLLVGHNGKIVFEQAYGNRALEPTVEPMTTDTIFDMASLTKVLVTTTAILQLYEGGKLNLDTPLAHYLPGFTAPPGNAAPSPATISPVPAYRYPKASALGLSSAKEGPGLQPLGYAFSSQPQQSAPTPDFTPASTLITQAIAAHKLPGAVLLVGHNGKIVFEQAYGNRALEPTVEPMTTDTIFDMASLTKVLVTTTAILQLYEGGKLNLDTPLAHYLPGFTAPPGNAAPSPATISPVPAYRYPKASALGLSSAKEGPGLQPLGYALQPAATNPTLQAYKSQITIRQLLTHYSGLPEDVSLKDPWGLAAPDKAEGLRRALAAIPYGPPAQTFKYSDINFILLGALVETLSGERLDDYAQQEILQPLLHSGMLATSSYHAFDRACRATSRFVGSAVEPGRAPRYSLRDECFLPAWSPTRDDPHTAPTAHDDQGTPATNPNFDHLLRGTVHDPTTRRMGGVAGHAGLFSTAEDTARFCQALLDKLLHNTGPFPLTQATLRLATSPQEPPTAVRTATVFFPDGTPTTGPASRGLGWDLNSPFSRPRGTLFPITTRTHTGSFGHTGFTGTSIWIDPTSNTYVILLANAIHPRGASPISALRGQVATAVAQALSTTPGAPRSTASSSTLGLLRPAAQTLTGIDVLESTNFQALTTLAAQQGSPLKLGLVTNQSGIDAQGRRTIDILLAAGKANPELQLTTLFSPEHGLYGKQDTENLAAEQDPATHLPVISLYGPKRLDKHPKQSDLHKLDAIVIDLQDLGVRFWTYETLTGYVLESCAKAKVPVFILDRPNPNGGLQVGGPISDAGSESYFNFMSMPTRNGMTLGELARYFNANATLSTSSNSSDPESLQLGVGAGASATGSDIVPPATLPGLHTQLTIIPMQNWSRSHYFTDTKLPWTPPSPNMRTPATAIVYPGVAFIEFNPISVGRGTPAPYENIGAPYIKASELAAYLSARHIPGIEITPTTLTIAETPEHYPYHGQTIAGLHFTVTDRSLLDTSEFGLEILSALHHLYPADFHLEKCRTILLNAATLEALKRGDDPRDIAATWQPALARFLQARKPYLLYP